MASNMQHHSPQPTDQDADVARFSDDHDTRLFESLRSTKLAAKMVRIKRNDRMVKSLWLEQGVDLNDAASRGLGEILDKNTHLEELILWECHFNLEAMCFGLQSNRSIRDLTLFDIDLRNNDTMNSLVPFLSHNPSLKSISLIGCNLRLASVEILANALSNHTENNLEVLNLSDNPIGDDVDDLCQALHRSRRLRELELSHCGIGLRACASLATLLAESDLAELLLSANPIDNNSVIALAGYLTKNRNLRVLSLTRNNRITKGGWSAMLKLVWAGSSIDELTNSNHVLHSLGFNFHIKKRVIRALGVADGNLLCSSLKLNEGDDKLSIARRKIIWGHARGDINLGKASIFTGAMPRVLSWIGNDSNESDAEMIQYHEAPLQEPELGIVRLGGIYCIVRSMPDLCISERDIPDQD